MPKIILHLDFNSYFASVEQQANPFLRGKAIAVAGKGKHSIDVSGAHSGSERYNVKHARLRRTVVTTASKEAKRLGVKTAMGSLEALQICPELIIIPGDPKKYSIITKRFLAILRRYTDAVEQFSTDEAFADISVAAGDWMGATLRAQRIWHEIRELIGPACTVSIGVANNKLLAKLACESMKPNGLTVVQPKDAKTFVAKQELQDICGIGPRIERRLHILGISSLKGLQRTPLYKLTDEFKSYGQFLYLAARGLGDDHINTQSEDPKSVGHSYTFPTDLDTPQEIKKNLLALCDKVAWRMRRDGFIATHISVYARYKEFGGTGRQKRYKEAMSDGLALYKNAWRLLDQIRDPDTSIRLLGISASGLIKTKMPANLFPKAEKVNSTLAALDKLQLRYGSGIWQRARTLNTEFKERTSGWHYDHEV